MLKELVVAFSKKSRIILLCSFIIILITIIRINIPSKSKYSLTDTNIYGQILEIKKYENRISLIVKGKEKVLMNYYGNLNVELGNYIKTIGTLSEPTKNRVPYLFNYKKYLKSKKINYLFEIEKIEIIKKGNILYDVKNYINKKVQLLDNAYLTTLILGINELDDKIYQSYQINGISHLFAISGMHISLLTLIFMSVLKKIIKKDIISYILVIIFLMFYMFLTNFSPSIIRSSFLFVGLSLKKIFKLNLETIDIFLVILNILLIYNPYYVYSISFLFSFIISFYLIIFNKLINKFKNYFIKVLVVSLISFLVSFPIVINNFFSINLLTPLINVVAVPIISLIVFPLTLITFIFPFFNGMLLFMVEKFEIVSLFLSKISLNLNFGYMNFLSIIIYYFIVTSLLHKTTYKKIIVFLIFIFFIYNSSFLNFYPKLTFIDVGQGDSILLELPFNQANILIDTGGNSKYDISKETLIPYLKASGIKKIDYLILTHGDFDHMGSSLNLVNSFSIDNIILNSYGNSQLEKELINKTKTKNIQYYNKHTLKIGSIHLYFINDKHYNENKDSLIIYTRIGNQNILLMGDSEKENEKVIINEYNLPKIDILKVGHHGSKTSSDLDFLRTIEPKYSIISVSKNNIYNHPHKIVLDNLKSVNSHIFLTSINGSIKFILKDKLEIYTCL